MKRTVVLVSACLFAIVVSGCGSSPDSLMKEVIKNTNDLAEAVEDNEPESKIEELKARLDKNSKQWRELKLSDAEAKEVTDRHAEELQRARSRLSKAMAERAKKALRRGAPTP